MQDSYADWMARPGGRGLRGDQAGRAADPGYHRRSHPPRRRARRIPEPENPPLMFSSFGAMLRISLRRSRADWPIVASAAIICLLAATVLAAGSL